MPFGPRQVGELIVGNALATETTVDTFIASASDKEIGIFSNDGTAVAKNKPFYFLQKTDGDASKNLNYEFSDVVVPAHIEKITAKAYAPEVMGEYKVDGFGTAGVIDAMRTYTIEIRVENQISPENFETIQGYYVTGEILGTDNAATVRDGLLKSLNSNLRHRGNSEFEAVADGTGIIVREKYQDNKPGKIDGRKLQFTVRAKVFNNVSNGYNSDLKLLTVTQTVEPSFGSGTGKWATNYEYFVKGYKYDPNREWAYPLDFDVPFYTSKNGKYQAIDIVYFSPRTETSVERQYKELTILFDGGADGEDVTAINAVLAKLRTIVSDYVEVPADLGEVEEEGGE